MPVDGLALIGFMDQAGALNYLRTLCVEPDSSDAALIARWEEAKLKSLPAQERAGNPHIRPLQQHEYPEMHALATTPHFQAAASDCVGFQLAVVEIAPLLAFQAHVSLEAHATLGGSATTFAEMCTRCLPLVPPSIQCDITGHGNGWWLSSDDLNATPLPLAPTMPGAPTGVILSQRNPLVQVARYEGRLYLKNGYHRVTKLQVAGISEVPCLLIEAGTESQAGMGAGTFGAQHFASANPPTCGHFTEERSLRVCLKRARRLIHITWSETVVYRD